MNLKTLAALRHGLQAIVCVGEHDRRVGEADAFVQAQVRAALRGAAHKHLPRVVIAYEPVWAIGQPEAAPPVYVFDRHRAIRSALVESFGVHAGAKPRIMYGGSVAPGNAADLVADPLVQGLFVGRAALTAEGFRRIALEALGRAGGAGREGA